MKKAIVLILTLGLVFSLNSYAQDTVDQTTDPEASTAINSDENQDAPPAPPAPSTTSENESEDEMAEAAPKKKSEGIKLIRDKFIEGTPVFMALPLLCLIFGLAIAIERIITLFTVSTNSNLFVQKVEDALVSGGVESAKDVCRNTRGPVASIYYQGLDRADEGIDMVEKSVVSYGGVQMGQLERGLIWLSLFIALAPMLGFMGTVIGMIFAFDDIQTAGDISPAIVANGIKVALLTTVAGLIVAIILQIFYNLLVSKIDAIVNNMEDASIKLVDMLIKNNIMKS
jgi:biopolymer transport protein ExbB